MASVPVILTGVIWNDADKSGYKATFYGEMSRSDVGVGGGPIYPEPKPPRPPTGIWPGPGDPDYPIEGLPHPEHPIVLPKPPVDIPPPSIWPPGPGIDWPEHPIVIPPPPDGEKPPLIPPGSLITWKPVWTPDQGWMVIGVPNVPHPAPSGAPKAKK